MNKACQLILLMSLFSLGCSNPLKDENPIPSPNPSVPTPTIEQISEELEVFVEEFENGYNLPVTYPVLFDDGAKTGGVNGQGTTIGLCETYSNGNRFVYINRAWFQNAQRTMVQKKILIFHELGHCSMSRNHDSRTYGNGMPYSIMYPVINAIVSNYVANENYYLTELGDSSIAGSDPSTYMTVDSHESDSFHVTENGCHHEIEY